MANRQVIVVFMTHLLDLDSKKKSCRKFFSVSLD